MTFNPSLCPRPMSHGTEFSNLFPCDGLWRFDRFHDAFFLEFLRKREKEILRIWSVVKPSREKNWKLLLEVLFFYSDGKVELMEVLRIRNSLNLIFLIDLFNSSKVSKCLDLKLLKLLFIFIFYHQSFWSFFHFFTQVLLWLFFSLYVVEFKIL